MSVDRSGVVVGVAVVADDLPRSLMRLAAVPLAPGTVDAPEPAAPVAQEAVVAPGGAPVGVADDLAAVVDARRDGVAHDTGGVDLDQPAAPVGEVAIADEPGRAHQPAAVVDVEDRRVAGRVGGVDRGVGAVVEHETMSSVVGVGVAARDLAVVVDALGHGAVEPGVGVGDGREAAVRLAHERADRRLLGVDEGAHDPTAIVDVGDHGRARPRRVDGGQRAVGVLQVAVGSAGPVDVLAGDLTAVVDRPGPGRGRPGHVDVAEAPAPVEQEAVLGRPDGGRAALVGVGADDAAPVVDRGGEGSLRAGEVDPADAAPRHAGIRGTACGRRDSRRRSARRCWLPEAAVKVAPGTSILAKPRASRTNPWPRTVSPPPSRPALDAARGGAPCRTRSPSERAGRSPPAIRAPAQNEVGHTAQTQAGGRQHRLRRRSGRGRRTGRGERRENDRGGHERGHQARKDAGLVERGHAGSVSRSGARLPRTYARLQRARINPTLGLSSRAAEVGCTRTANLVVRHLM